MFNLIMNILINKIKTYNDQNESKFYSVKNFDKKDTYFGVSLQNIVIVGKPLNAIIKLDKHFGDNFHIIEYYILHTMRYLVEMDLSDVGLDKFIEILLKRILSQETSIWIEECSNPFKIIL